MDRVDLHAAGGGATVGPRGPSVRKPRAGFTMVELLIVLGVVGILLTIALPRIDVARFQLDSAIQQVASSVAASRGQAVLRQHDFVITFDEAGNRFYLHRDTNNNGVTDGGEERRVVELPGPVRFARGGAAPLNGAAAVISFTKVSEQLPALKFHRNGAASEEGIVYITSMRAGDGTGDPQDTRALMIERATGRVRCFTYRTLAWLEGC